MAQRQQEHTISQHKSSMHHSASFNPKNLAIDHIDSWRFYQQSQASCTLQFDLAL